MRIDFLGQPEEELGSKMLPWKTVLSCFLWDKVCVYFLMPGTPVVRFLELDGILGRNWNKRILGLFRLEKKLDRSWNNRNWIEFRIIEIGIIEF